MRFHARKGRALPVLALLVLASSIQAEPVTTGTHVVLCWNDLGMHCMNKDHDRLSILPPYNTLTAQVIERGSATTLPRIVADPAEISLEYSIPGNTYSVGKTNFWTYAEQLFGVPLPPDVGLTGRGLTGTFSGHTGYYEAEGIPVTPFPDATPTVEDPYQQALVIARDAVGAEVARSRPVIPVSTEVNCVSMGCHSSVSNILNEHEDVSGFDTSRPVLCASCHGSPPLTGPVRGRGDWFSLRIHEQHSFIDQEIPGINGCYKCHPGPQTNCLRDVMATQHGMVCQDCHGNMRNMAQTIDNGRIPWLDEPACRTCHTSTYGEPVGVLFRNATGHGGVRCAACHDSPHAIYPSREPRDNQNMIDLQGHAGTLGDCTVCHGVSPAGAGPHGLTPTAAIQAELTGGAAALAAYPNPVRFGSPVRLTGAASSADGHLLVFDAAGRTIRRLDVRVEGARAIAGDWDLRNSRGEPVAPGVYFVSYRNGSEKSTARVVVLK